MSWPKIVWSANPLDWSHDFVQDFVNVLLWIVQIILTGIADLYQAITQAVAWLSLSVMQALIIATAGLGPFSGPIFLVLLVGTFAFLMLLFDQIVSWIPK